LGCTEGAGIVCEADSKSGARWSREEEEGARGG